MTDPTEAAIWKQACETIAARCDESLRELSEKASKAKAAGDGRSMYRFNTAWSAVYDIATFARNLPTPPERDGGVG